MTDNQALKEISNKQAWYYKVVPQSINNNKLKVFIDKERKGVAHVEELEFVTGREIIIDEVPSEQIIELLNKFYPRDQTDSRLQQNFYSGSPDMFLGHLIEEARNLKSSDIHIEVYEAQCRVRIRIDGTLVQRYLIEKNQYPSLVNKIKIIANLDIAEKRLPQDGRILYENNGHKFDIRVSVLPTLHGEKIVLRLLSNDATNIEIKSLGFADNDLHNYLEGIRKPNGILLISGPTGSGKTTTLYATLKLLNKSTRNILTIEDPIEYTLEGINQVQLKESIGLSFAAALRNFLRQDPDIIMLGEIRDNETANMAIRAALTGHLVLSTIHTNSAWGTISRLIDMGTPPFLLASTLNTSVAQRLVRLLCDDCKKSIPFDYKLYPVGFKPFAEIKNHYTPVGCTKCYNTGYRGRKAVYEVIPIDTELSYCIKNMQYDISSLLDQRKINTLARNSFELFAEGKTSLDEIYTLLMN